MIRIIFTSSEDYSKTFKFRNDKTQTANDSYMNGIDYADLFVQWHEMKHEYKKNASSQYSDAIEKTTTTKKIRYRNESLLIWAVLIALIYVCNNPV